MPATENVWRNLRTMHVVFAVSSVVLLLATIWMFAHDYDDEWRNIQRVGFELSAQQIRDKEQKLETKKFEDRQQELRERVVETQALISQHQDEIKPIRAEKDRLDGEMLRATQQVRFTRAQRDKARADFDLKVRDGASKKVLRQYREVFDDIQKEVVGLEVALQDKQAELDAVTAKLAAKLKPHSEAVAALKKHQTELDRLEKARLAIDPETSSLAWGKRKLMELPIIEGFNGHLKISQLWLPDLTQNYGGMRDVARFDRCITCHMNIDRVESGNVPSFPLDPHGMPQDSVHATLASHTTSADAKDKPAGYKNPYATHPNPDLFLTASSPHPMQKFGCTSCHEGQGSGTSFQNTSHSPSTPEEAEKWHEKYGWFHNHFWEYPMYPKRLAEAACLKCHHNVVELGINPKFGASAPKVYEGYELVRKYGCFGCHEINGYNGGKQIGPDLRLEPQTPEEAARIAADATSVAGTERKVGPGLRHFASKTTPGWAEYWVEEPSRFHPETKMPQFFNLSNQHDKMAQRLQPVEIAAIVAYLFEKSEDLKLDNWAKDYTPNAERGKLLFSQRGCLACHSHDDFKGITADFGPNLTKVHQKIKAGEDGARWVYTWIRDPQRHSPRSKMPDLFLEPEGTGKDRVDPAADIAAYLLQNGPKDYQQRTVDPQALDELVEMYLAKVLTAEQAAEAMKTGKYPVPADKIKGDEIELTAGSMTEAIKMQYIGRRSISRYGCYGCHDIPGFDKARPIGTGLADWGRKDPTKLALEHIEEYLMHHGEPDGSSTAKRIERAVRHGLNNEFETPEEAERENSAAFFYEQLQTHGRAGFLWQKLRAPRSYDYEKIATKGYDERLRMPKFSFNEREIESVATFILGLVSQPPAEKYQYRPQGLDKSRLEGEKLLVKYNCVGCHMVDLPEIRYGVNPDDIVGNEPGPGDYEAAIDLLLKLKPPHSGETGKKLPTGEPIIAFKGLPFQKPDPLDEPEFQEYSYDLWQTLKIGDKILWPGERILVPATKQVSVTPARGGHFAEWLVDDLMELDSETNRFLAWQASPPPLYLEGIKVQTPWLYNFLRNPYRIRHTTVLRMPRFNMSDEEARELANYFSAVDGSTYPYQTIPQRDPEYLSEKEATHPHYLSETWKLLNAPLCIKCHSLGGREYKASDPKKDIRGPNLDQVTDRLRPEWTLLWLFKPQWIAPYTSMPAPFPKNQEQFPELFAGHGQEQTVAARDALMNYYRLLEKEGKLAVASGSKPAAAEQPPASPPAAAKVSEPKPEPKAKAEVKPEVKPEAKPAPKAKAEVKPEPKPAPKVEAKPKAEAKPAPKPAAKPEVKAEAKAPPAKPKEAPKAKEEAQPVAKPEAGKKASSDAQASGAAASAKGDQ